MMHVLEGKYTNQAKFTLCIDTSNEFNSEAKTKAMQVAIETNNVSTDAELQQVIKKLAACHNTTPERIELLRVVSGSRCFEYNVESSDYSGLDRAKAAYKLENHFEGFKSLKLHYVMVDVPSFNEEMLDEAGHKDFSDQNTIWNVGPTNRKKPHIQPHGWIRYGLKVLGNPAYKNDDWLTDFGENNPKLYVIHNYTLVLNYKG